jgi:ATP-dependent RNA helicase DDX27
MEVINSGFFQDLDDDQEAQSGWSFSNANVEQEPTEAKSKQTSLPKKRNRSSTTNTAEVSFGELGLAKPLAKACETLGYSGPTEIQQKAIVPIIKGSDVLISAETGSGKTAAFSLPMLQRLLFRNKRLQATRALVLSPARELAQQTHSMIQSLAQNTDIKSGVVMGGANSAMEQRLLASSPDVLIGTPGRILDHLLNSQGINLDYVEFLVLDEADRLLEMGFKSEIQKILSELQPERQTVLASATLNEDVTTLANLALKHPIKVGRSGIPTGLQQVIVRLKEDWRRDDVVVSLLKHHVSEEVIVFFKTKQDTHKMYLTLEELGMSACELHGGMTQGMRLQALREFQSGEKSILVATDVAARGLDLPVQTVINVNMPLDPRKLLHRVGRTARAGKSGLSITLCDDYERTKIRKVIKKAATSLKVDPEHVKEARGLIKSVKPAVNKRLEQDKLDKELKIAEIENKKAMNLIIHADEIYNKPKKRWIRKETEEPEDSRPKDSNRNPRKKGSSNDVIKKMLSNPLMIKHARQSEKGIGMIKPKDKKKPKGKRDSDSKGAKVPKGPKGLKGGKDSNPKVKKPNKLKDLKLSKGGKSFNSKKRYKRR